MFDNLPAFEFAKGLKEDKDIVLLDVRTEGEFTSGHIPGAKNLDIMNGEFQDGVESLDKSLKYYVYCRSGARSANACGYMAQLGFEDVTNLMEGILGWQGEVV